MGLIHKNESASGVRKPFRAPGILSFSRRMTRTRVRFRKFSSSSLSPRNPSEGISNAWDSQEIPDCQSQELRLLSGLREIFLVKVIRDWLNPRGQSQIMRFTSEGPGRGHRAEMQEGERSQSDVPQVKRVSHVEGA